MKKEYTLVETISQFRVRYVVKIPDEFETSEQRRAFLEDKIDSEDFHEFSQKHLIELITSTREMDESDVLELCDADNDYAKSWPTEQKLNIFVRRNNSDDGK